MYGINVPDHIVQAGKEAQYVNAANRAIQRNAAITRRKVWLAAHDDAQRIYDWVNQCGEFDGYFMETRDGVRVRVTEDELAARGGYPGLENDARWTNHPMTDGIFAGDFGQVIKGMRDALDEFGGLSDKQTDVLRKALARKEQWTTEAEQRKAAALARDAQSEFIGEIKERREWNLTIRKIFVFEGAFGMTYFNIMADCDGNIIVGKGTKRYGVEGQTVAVVATIVKHDTRDGVKQTIINRPKFKEPRYV